MRESYRLMLKSGNLGNSNLYMSLIFVGHEKALDKTFQEIQSTMEALVAKIND